MAKKSDKTQKNASAAGKGGAKASKPAADSIRKPAAAPKPGTAKKVKAIGKPSATPVTGRTARTSSGVAGKPSAGSKKPAAGAGKPAATVKPATTGKHGDGKHGGGKRADGNDLLARPANVQPHPLEQKFVDMGIDSDLLDSLPPGLLASIPPEMLKAFQDALKSGDESSLIDTLAGVSQEERLNMLEVVEAAAREMGIEPDEIQEVEEEMLLDEHKDFISVVAELALGDPPIELRSQVEGALGKLEADGWNLLKPIQRIWDGERDCDTLVDGLDWDESVLVGGILDQIERLTEFRAHRAELIATFPPPFQAAFRSGDPDAVEAALHALPPDEQVRFHEAMDALLVEAGLHTEEEVAEEEDDILDTFGDLIDDIADVALSEDEDGLREEVEEELEDLEENGWNLLEAVRAIWDGERDEDSLCDDLPEEECSIIAAILAQIDDAQGEDE